MYEKVFITHIPAFYKINLYNEINKKINIFVIFIAAETSNKRTDDFIAIKDASFEYIILTKLSFEKRKKLKSIFTLRKVIKNLEFIELVLPGWDLIEFWYAAFVIKRVKISLALESTISESNIKGIKGILKKIFIQRITNAFVSGKKQQLLLQKLGYKQKITLTKGVGIIRKNGITYTRDKSRKNKIVYIGRLSPEKNLHETIKIVNKFPEISLDIYGSGDELEKLKIISGKNISFKGVLSNSEVKYIIRNSDFLILLSKSEPWGLVIDESLYYGVPVIISDSCGSEDIVTNGSNGFIIESECIPSSMEGFFNNYELNLKSISDEYIGSKFINNKDVFQINAYT